MLDPAADSASLTLSAVRERYSHYALVIRNISENTTRARLVYIERLFHYFGSPATAAGLFSKIGSETLSAFFADYAMQHGQGSRRSMQDAARSFLHFAYDDRVTANDLSALVPTVRRFKLCGLPKALPEEAILALEQSIDRSSPIGRRDAAILCLLSTYGVRGVQVRQLRLDDIDWRNDRIHFPAAKGGRMIQQHLTTRAGNRLTDYLVNGRPESPLPQVFVLAKTGAALSKPAHLSGMIRRRILRANISVPDGVSCGTHGLRHAFAVRMTGQVPFKDVVDMLGHRDPSSTLIYAKTDTQTLQQAALPWPGGVS
jgi:site-specific recombinase XerD